MCARNTPQTHLIVASLSGALMVVPTYIVLPELRCWRIGMVDEVGDVDELEKLPI